MTDLHIRGRDCEIEGWMVSPIADISNWPLPVSIERTRHILDNAVMQLYYKQQGKPAPPVYAMPLDSLALWGRVLLEYTALQEALNAACQKIAELERR